MGNKVVVTCAPEFEARLEALMKEHAAEVQLSFARLQYEAMAAAFYVAIDPEDESDMIDVDYSALEDRVMAHMTTPPDFDPVRPYLPSVYTKEETPMKAAVATTLVAASMSGGILEKPEIPDRVCINPSSPYFWRQYKSLGVKIDGEDRPGDVHEFCVSEGWAMVRARNEKGQFRIDPSNASEYLLERTQGKIEPYFRRPPETVSAPTQGDYDRIKAAEAKRARKAARHAEHK